MFAIGGWSPLHVSSLPAGQSGRAGMLVGGGPLALTSRAHRASHHLSPGRGMRVESAVASVHFKITGSEEPSRVGACMRVRESNFNVQIHRFDVHGTRNQSARATIRVARAPKSSPANLFVG